MSVAFFVGYMAYMATITAMIDVVYYQDHGKSLVFAWVP